MMIEFFYAELKEITLLAKMKDVLKMVIEFFFCILL